MCAINFSLLSKCQILSLLVLSLQNVSGGSTESEEPFLAISLLVALVQENLEKVWRLNSLPFKASSSPSPIRNDKLHL